MGLGEELEAINPEDFVCDGVEHLIADVGPREQKIAVHAAQMGKEHIQRGMGSRMEQLETGGSEHWITLLQIGPGLTSPRRLRYS